MSGLMQGTIARVDDPEKRGRIKAFLPDLYHDAATGEVIESPWLEPKGSFGAGFGLMVVPPVGAPIWVQSRWSDDGDTYQQVYEPGRHGGGDASHAPAVARGEDDESSGALKAGTSFSVPSANLKKGEALGTLEIEGLPPSMNAGVYPQNRVMKTPGGLVFEFDDTPGAARFHIWHPSGTYFEVGDKGVLVQRATKMWTETAETVTEYIGGDHRRRVNGNEMQAVGGNSVRDITGSQIVQAKDISLIARVNLMLEASGEMNVTARGKVSEKFLAGKTTSIVGDNACAWAGQGNFFSLGAVNMLAMGSITVGTPLLRVGPPALAAAATPVSLSLPLFSLLETLGAHTHPVVEGAPSTGPAALWGAPVAAAQAAVASKTLMAV